MTYSPIDPSEYDTESPVTAPLLARTILNPLAAIAGEVDSPYVEAQWHPYDGVLVGDGGDGLIFDYAVSGAAATVETPNFADGWEYRLLLLNVTALGAGNVPRIELYRATSAAYATAAALSAGTFVASQGYSGPLDLIAPRVDQRYPTVTGALGPHYCGAAPDLSGAQKVGKARFSWSASDVQGGKIYLYRRKCWLS